MSELFPAPSDDCKKYIASTSHTLSQLTCFANERYEPWIALLMVALSELRDEVSKSAIIVQHKLFRPFSNYSKPSCALIFLMQLHLLLDGHIYI